MELAKTVEMFGKQEKVGDWVVVDASMTHVLGVGSTPEQALEKAGVDTLHPQASESRPLLLQVSDPSLTCLY
jgi:hypothetical protein